jgi:hypothetical protein
MRAFTGALLVSACALCAGCGQDNLDSYVEPGATTAASAIEISGHNSPNDLDPLTAARYIDHVRLGRGLDAEGQVPRDFVASGFHPGEAIQLSMEVTDAPAGSIVRVSVREVDTNRETWVQEKKVAPGKSYLSFAISTELLPSDYRADVIIGDEVVADKKFQVLERQA